MYLSSRALEDLSKRESTVQIDMCLEIARSSPCVRQQIQLQQRGGAQTCDIAIHIALLPVSVT